MQFTQESDRMTILRAMCPGYTCSTAHKTRVVRTSRVYGAVMNKLTDPRVPTPPTGRAHTRVVASRMARGCRVAPELEARSTEQHTAATGEQAAHRRIRIRPATKVVDFVLGALLFTGLTVPRVAPAT